MTSINCLEKKLISNSEFPEYTLLARRRHPGHRANPGTASQFPANCAVNSVSVPAEGGDGVGDTAARLAVAVGVMHARHALALLRVIQQQDSLADDFLLVGAHQFDGARLH